MVKKQGWFKESGRHALASKGIKTVKGRDIVEHSDIDVVDSREGWVTQKRWHLTEDILSYYIEETEGEIDYDELQEIKKELNSRNENELEDYWYATVGEWLASRGLDPDEQIEKVIDENKERDYGYVYGQYAVSKKDFPDRLLTEE